MDKLNLEESPEIYEEIVDNHEEEEEERALLNPLVVQKILENLQITDLLRCRLVNQMWFFLSTTLILRMEYCIVKIIYDPNGKNFVRYTKKKKPHRRWTTQNDMALGHHQQKEEEEPDLTVLNEIVKNSVSFPCSTFNFLGGGDLAHGEVDRFFKIFGHHIKTLGLAEGRNMTSLTSKLTFKNIIFHFTPNLQNLAIRGFDYSDDGCDEEEEEEVSKNLLPSLQTFSWRGGGEKTVVEILKNAPNLRSIQHFDLKCDLDVVLKAGKCHAVRKLYCDRQTELQKLGQFLQIIEFPSSSSSSSPNLKPQLQSLTFFLDESILKDPPQRRMELVDSFLKLMQLHKDSLEFLDLSELCFHTEILTLPKFSRLKVLVGGMEGECFSRINLSQIFPTLHTIDCRGRRQRHFPPPNPCRGTLDSVKTIIISARSTEMMISRLHELCPNVKNLILHTRDSLDEALPVVFKTFKNLQRLDLKVEEYEEEFFYMDSILCGMDEETCERLKAQAQTLGLVEEPDRVEEYQKFRTAPSLCDLKDLKSLRIIFDSYSHFKLAKPTRNYFPISWISGLYTFRLMPNLSVTIEFDHNCPWIGEIKPKFESIGPYVNFAHRHHDFDD